MAQPAGNPGVVLTHFSELREHISTAFHADVVELDIAAYSGETFYNVLSEFLAEVSEGRLRPRRLHVRLLVPDCSQVLAVPCLTDTLAEDDAYKISIQERNRRFAGVFLNYFEQIRSSGIVQDAHMEIRLHRLAPLFKMIMINHRVAFFGLYPIAKTDVAFSGRLISLWDYRGERVRLIGLRTEGSILERDFFSCLKDWYGVVWNYLSQPLAPTPNV